VTKIAVLASYNGSGFKALYEASQRKEINLEIVLLISNNSNATALQSACELGIETALVNAKTDENPDKKIEQLLHACGCKYVFLSGYMKKLSSNVTNNFKIINSHPSLLPKYGGEGMYGRFVHEAVIKNQEKESGVTIHEVDENYDEGKVILQKKLILSKDESIESLETKIKKLEQNAIVEAFKNIEKRCL
jgi:phosphoribosylglycinamide formyltransferase-1